MLSRSQHERVHARAHPGEHVAPLVEVIVRTRFSGRRSDHT